MTIGCAKCHDHKFDVISQRDYYALQAMVAGVRHGEREIDLERTPEQEREVEELRRQLAMLEGQIARSAGRRPSRWPGSTCRWPIRPRCVRRCRRRATSSVLRRLPPGWIRFTILATNNVEPCLDELEIFAADDGRNVALASSGGGGDGVEHVSERQSSAPPTGPHQRRPLRQRSELDFGRAGGRLDSRSNCPKAW